jgi:hypothetical protein
MQITIDIFNRPDSLCPLISQIGAKSPKTKNPNPKFLFRKLAGEEPQPKENAKLSSH